MSTTEGPTRFAIHSVEGFGKTTILAHFPRVLIVGNERGVPRDLPFSVPTLAINSWMDMFDTIDSLRRDQHDFQTLAIDTVDWLEPLCHQFVCERDSGRETEMNKGKNVLSSIEDYGYGKGYLCAEEEFRKLINALDVLQYERQMHIALAMHSHVKTFKNPAGEDFDRWEPKCHQRVARVCVEWAENVVFGHFEVSSGKIASEAKAKKENARAKGISSGRRLLGTQNNAMYDAKNRHRLPPEMELGDPRELIPLLLGSHLGARTAFEGQAAYSEQRTALPPRPSAPPAPPPRSEPPPAPPIERPDSPRGEIGSQARNPDADKRDARTWTEPTRPTAPSDANRQQSQTPPPPPPRDERATSADIPNHLKLVDDKLSKEVDAAIFRAGQQRGDVYKRKIEKWVLEAADDQKSSREAKLRAIVNRVNQDLAAPAAS
jgi:hypothetical protein